MPDNVFVSTFKQFLFFTFDEMHMPHFFNHIKQYLLETEESEFWLMSVDEPPKEGLSSSSDVRSVIQVSVSDSEDDYLQAVNGFNDDNPASFDIHAASFLIAFSPRANWTIFGSRDADIAVYATSTQTTFDIFNSIYGPELLDGVEDAADFSYGESGGDVSLKEKIRQNYSSRV